MMVDKKVCIVFKLLYFKKWVSDWTLSGVQCTKYNGRRSMVRRMLKAPPIGEYAMQQHSRNLWESVSWVVVGLILKESRLQR
jgi:hypothetical protein